jgi:hypothetical protein
VIGLPASICCQCLAEQEVIYEYSEIQSISPDLDEFPDFRAF